MFRPMMFQSTPVITDGRTRQEIAIDTHGPLFQSTPVITDGRTQWGQAPLL